MVQRVQVVMDHFLSQIDDGSQKGKRTAFLLRKLVGEAADEMAEVPPEMIEFYFRQAGAMMYWAGTGERILNIPLPAAFRPDSELERRDDPVMNLRDHEAFLAVESAEYIEARAEGQRAELARIEGELSDE